MGSAATNSSGPWARALSREIRAELGRRDLDRKDLADAAGLSRNYLNVRLRDEKPLNLDDIAAIAAAFEITPLALMQRAVDAGPAAAPGDERHGPLVAPAGGFTGPNSAEDEEMLRRVHHRERSGDR